MTASPQNDYYSQYLTDKFEVTFDKKLDRLIDEGNVRTSTARKKMNFTDDSSESDEMFPSIERKGLGYDAQLWTTENQSNFRDQKSSITRSYQGDTSAQLDATLAQKEDMLTALSDHPKNKSLVLLQDHLKDMTSLVRRLSRNVDRCEAATGMNNMAIATIAGRVSGLEGNRTSAELDSKIGRCDVGIREVVREVRECSRSLGAIKQSAESQGTLALDRQKKNEAKIEEMERRLKRLQGDVTADIEALKDTTNKDMISLGSASHVLEKGVSDSIQLFRDQCSIKFQHMIVEVEEKLEERLEERGQQLDRIENQFTTEMTLLTSKVQELSTKQGHLDHRVTEDIENCTKLNKKSIDRLRGECMCGFRTLQDSIDTMHSILDSKIHLVEEDIRCEIRKAMKTVVVV